MSRPKIAFPVPSMTDIEKNLTSSPIIGILSVDIAIKLREKYGEKFTSYLPASYVKFIEGGGGRVVPIWIGRDREYYKELLSHLNGVLLPGGAVFFHENHGFGDAGKFIYEIATEMNEKGIYMPIFGICLGYEILLYASAKNELRQDCDSMRISLPVNFREGVDKSKLFGNASEEILRILSGECVAYHYHKYCITEEDLRDHNIHNKWTILATNSDHKVQNYISIIEHRKHPFYGVQFHPEKNPYEHKRKTISHTQNSIKCSNYFAQFFVNESRKNSNSFEANDENRHLIYNYPVIFTSDENIPWEQCYLFEKESNYPGCKC